jgi:hypothetical protein
MSNRSLAAVLIALLAAACATPSSHIMLGTARPAISPDDVRVYATSPDQPFAEIALLNASSGNSLGTIVGSDSYSRNSAVGVDMGES